ncbi:Beta-galactosidase [Pirellulimonas nuda]|uniref:Beta-galactosidase n=1 Tax=Pirellulimonas nuda TaxID=2528009 RepID=A0A518DC88_9BACT|nr:glycoside hydrolase family 2 TIM barrel-domain containing protein [Pirellulimonas nuda]QDU89089.1 Beta-galactosidase [Pirellulimonas nuda]
MSVCPGRVVIHQLLIALTIGAAFLFVAAESGAGTADFNDGWRFRRGDDPRAEEIDYDDADWTQVDTPHDWAIGGPFNPEEHGYAGKLPWRGVAWYRKRASLDPRVAGARVFLDFDGVMASPKVYVNGVLAGEWDYGYTPFRVELTPHLRASGDNLIAVRVDTTRHGTRWYPGAGIYRKVSLTISPPIHLAKEGTCVETPEVTPEQAQVVVSNEVVNGGDVDEAVQVEVTLVSPSGQRVAQRSVGSDLPAGAITSVSTAFEVADPERWGLQAPNLYTAVTRLMVNGQEVERRETRFGVRSIELTASGGLRLNGSRIPLRGVNLHHDLGPLGAAFNRRAADRQLEILQDMGVNAVRTAHNPPATEFLDLCDQRGLLVYAELFDKWDATSDREATAAFEPHYARHAAAMVRRDRNHPSVIVWSIGNEILEAPADPHGLTREKVEFARQAILKHDNTRPVGLACHVPTAADSGVLDSLDFTGWNYQARYERAWSKYPNKPIIYSETASAVSTRGDYRLPLNGTKCEYLDVPVVSAFELSSAVWSDIPEIEFERLRRDDYVAGEFVWTGFDYLGEPTPFAQNARSSYFGILDLVGLPKDRFYLYRSIWRPEVPTVRLAPHWNWPGHEGEAVPIIVYTNGDSAELFLNDKSLGFRRKRDRPAPPEDLAVDVPLQNGAAILTDAVAFRSPSREGGARLSPQQGDVAFDCSTVDLGRPEHVRAIVIDFERESKLYGYRVEAYVDGGDWREVASHVATTQPLWGGVHEAVHRVDVEAGRFRVVFDECLDGVEERAKGVRVYADEYESPYFLPTYDYRLRWNNVPYMPGVLRVVAYQNGSQIGEDVVRTAGRPAKIVLSADRAVLSSSGEDLAYITIQAYDDVGVPCPLAENLVRVEVAGAGSLVATGNGDPTSMRSFHEHAVPLFGGKAVAIVRADRGQRGDIQVRAESDQLEGCQIDLQSMPVAD